MFNNITNNEINNQENYLNSVEQEAEKLIDDVFSELDDILDDNYYENNNRESPDNNYHEFTQENFNNQKNQSNNNNLNQENQDFEEIQNAEFTEETPLSLEAELLSEITPKKPEIIEEKYFNSTAFAEQEVLTKTPKIITYLDKILFVSSLGFLMGVILWLINIEKLKIPVLANQNLNSPSPENITPSPDQEFANYLLQSLKILEEEKPLIAVSPPLTNTQKSEEKTPPNNINNTPVKTNSPTKIIERIYIPFYQETPTTPSTVPTPPSPPVPTPPPPRVSTPTPPVRKITPTSPRVSTPTPVVENKISPPPVPTPPPVVENKIPSPPVATNTIPDRHTVVGLLELGERSAALFQVNGVTRRIQVGEKISPSGWVLESVGNDQIIVNRNGQNKTLSVGQEF